MSKRTCIILVICLLIVAGSAGAYWYLRKKQKASDAGTDGTLPAGDGGQHVDTDPVLNMGSRGENVKKLQQFLHEKLVLAPIYNKVSPVCNGKTLDNLTIDGIFGEKTECACQWWFGKTSVKLSEIPDGTLS